MHKKHRIILCLLMLAGSALYGRPAAGLGRGAAADTLIFDKPVLISDQFAFTEGPAADRKGNVYFTDQPNNRIWKYSTDGKLSVFMEPAGRSNGMYFDRKGNLISCADEHDQLWSVSPQGKVKVLVKDFHGARLNGPNDVWADAKGGIYFTDPYYQRDYWKRKAPDPNIKHENVYYLPPHDTMAIIVADDLAKPNGLVGTADGRHLFVSDIQAGKIYQYSIAADGTLQDKQLFVSHSTDGMTIDLAGNLYLAGKGVTVYNSQGIQVGYIPIPQPWTANICFGGKHRDQLFITASTAFYKVQTKMKGSR